MYIDEPGISTPGMTIDTAGVSKTDGIELINVHVINIIAPNDTTIPTFMNHLQNVGEKLEILDISPRSLLVFHIMTGKLVSTPNFSNLPRNVKANIQMITKAIK